MSCIPLTDSRNTAIYRELMERETKGATEWDKQYSSDAPWVTPSMDQMINLGSFGKYAKKMAAFNPVEDQLLALREERKNVAQEFSAFSKATLARQSEIPVSQSSVDVWGDAAWHTQPKKDYGSPSTYQKDQQLAGQAPTWVRRKWDIDHQGFGFLPAHVTSRSLEFASVFRSPRA